MSTHRSPVYLDPVPQPDLPPQATVRLCAIGFLVTLAVAGGFCHEPAPTALDPATARLSAAVEPAISTKEACPEPYYLGIDHHGDLNCTADPIVLQAAGSIATDK